jgi:stress-induced morphogen
VAQASELRAALESEGERSRRLEAQLAAALADSQQQVQDMRGSHADHERRLKDGLRALQAQQHEVGGGRS